MAPRHEVNKAKASLSNGETRARDVPHLLDRLVSPEQREHLLQSILQAPLRSSFIITQLVFASLPLTGSLAFIISSAASILATTVVALLTAVGLTLGFLAPVLCVTIPTATLAWALIVGTIASTRYIYTRLYVDSSLAHGISDFRQSVEDAGRQIEENASKEAREYRDEIGQGVQEARDGAVQWGDEKAQSLRSNGVVDAFMKDDGIVDGIMRKGNRVANRSADEMDKAKHEANAEVHKAQKAVK